MELSYLKVFNTLAQEQSYAKAAERMHISQPAISAQIKKLEESLGVKLFDKVGNRAVLNENGKLLFETTRKVFSILEDTEHEIINKKKKITGPVWVGGSSTPGTYLLPKIIGEFKRIYPEPSIILHISNTDEIATKVMNNQLDFAVNGVTSLNYNSSIYIEKLMDDRIVLAVAPTSPLAGAELSHVNDLANVDFIAYENNQQLNRIIEDIMCEMDNPSKILMSMGSIDAIKQAAAAGLGIAPVTYSSVSLELELGILSEVKIKGRQWYHPYNLIYNKNKYHTPAANKLMEMVRENLGKQY